MALSSEQRRARALIAAHSRKTHANPDALAQARADFQRAKTDARIDELVSAAPALTLAQRDRLAVLLRPSAAA